MNQTCDQTVIPTTLPTEGELIDRHAHLSRLLLALETLSARQQHLTEASVWETVLAQKQVLLDALSSYAFGELCAQTQAVVARLWRDGEKTSADRLSALMVTHSERLQRIAADERAAQEAAKSYATELQQELTTKETRIAACKSYRKTDHRNTPRFYSGLR